MMKPLDDLTNLELPIDGKIIKLVFKSKATEELIADIEKKLSYAYRTESKSKVVLDNNQLRAP